LNKPFGIAFYPPGPDPKWIYIANTNAVVRFTYANGDLEARGEDFYRHYIALALERAGGVQVKAAEMLGMSFRSFRYYAKKFNIR